MKEYSQKEMISRIQSLADAHGMNTAELCRKIGVNYATATNWYKKGGEPKLPQVASIAKLFNTSTDFIIFGKNPGKEVVTIEESPYVTFEEKDLLEEYQSLTPVQKKMVYGYIHGITIGNRERGQE